MYQKVLVPLDTSELAECALPEVKRLAKGGFVGQVILLNVFDVNLLRVPSNHTGVVDINVFRNAQRDTAMEGKKVFDIDRSCN